MSIPQETIRSILNTAVKRYTHSILAQEFTPSLDARILLSHVLHISTAQLFARLNDPVPPDLSDQFFELWNQRLNGTPVAYLTGVREFFGLDFVVDPRVLIPRPDTEILVEQVLLDWPKDTPDIQLIDCCTGSGCIALSLASQRMNWKIFGSDISADALTIAKVNGQRLSPHRVTWVKSNLLQGFDGMKFHIIASNPPYLTDNETTTRVNAGWIEPELALKSGSRGMDHIPILIKQAYHLLYPGGSLYIESSPFQTAAIRQLLDQGGYDNIASFKDLEGNERVTRGQR